ncbi:Solute carrier family 35 member G1 [Holothuria leucospilota]|uniref:Solute carrier family 35 member G1 n=1 Tax=Holothuria leucospilota TaxID=206669 RepID=A0A9Q1H489_HOLLE|nr:Solute carrier family 35 member G1 [Holothuria leucospilota]
MEVEISSSNDTENIPWKIISDLRQRYGVILALLSAFVYSLQSILMKISTVAIDPVMVVVIMAPVMAISGLICSVYKGICPPKIYSHYMWLLFCGTLMSVYLTMLSFALLYVDVGDAITVTYTSLIFVGIVSWVMLREPPQKLDAAFSIVAFAGVVFIARPPFIFGQNSKYDRTLLGVAFAFGSALAIGFIVNTMRKQQQLGINAFMSLVVNGIVITLTSVVLATVFQRWHIPCPLEWLSSLGAGFCYFLGQLMVYYALNAESSTLVNVLLTTEIVFAFILQLTIMNIHPSWTSYVGAVLVTVSCIGITLNRKKV